ncbi:hypothetical protein DXD50_04950 [Dorea formicigenerans]|jgi:hypothetical protein|nr:hypothetical protein DXD50_04950 [Dorea formicigenerans]
MGNEPCADNYGPVNVMKLRERIFQETEREKAQDYLWNELVLLQSQTFRTVKGLEYTYQIRGNEMFVSRKTKSITKASVDLALEKIIELSGKVAGPKKLKCFGASYLYPIFIEMGLIKNSPFFIERAKIR